MLIDAHDLATAPLPSRHVYAHAACGKELKMLAASVLVTASSTQLLWLANSKQDERETRSKLAWNTEVP